ncbi:MAG: hypothetical protein ACE5JX_06460 [Acidobacteriota bacterium]
MKVLALWSPIRPGDNKFTARDASIYLTDPRVEHFWDLWSFGLNYYTKHLNYPRGKLAWDIFVLYEPELKWGEASAPEPTVWLQDHGLEIGLKHSKERLAREMEKLIQ